jgi:hypothetical protein
MKHIKEFKELKKYMFRIKTPQEQKETINESCKGCPVCILRGRYGIATENNLINNIRLEVDIFDSCSDIAIDIMHYFGLDLDQCKYIRGSVDCDNFQNWVYNIGLKNRNIKI